MAIIRGFDDPTSGLGTAERPAEAGAAAAGAVERKRHDLVFKTVFRHFFADLVELVEPEFAARVDLTNVEFLEKETFSDFPEGTRQTRGGCRGSPVGQGKSRTPRSRPVPHGGVLAERRSPPVNTWARAQLT
ncbi:MAG: hypothetical protein GY856_32435, partial [bacterium]|nr:hypothetical protein [bacterium]